MAQYLLAVHSVEGEPVPDDATVGLMYAQVGQFNQGLQAAGQWVFAGGLVPSDAARVVSTAGGIPEVTDGPRTPGGTQLGGFWVVEAADDDEALALATKASAACMGPVEVRPFQVIPED